MPNQEHSDIVNELHQMIIENKWEKDFAKGIENAFSLAEKDLLEARIYEGKTHAETVMSFLHFCDRYVKWVPTTTSSRDEALWMLSVFYFVFDQVPIFSKKYQTPILPDATPNEAPISKWLHTYANDLGKWMDDPKSVAAVDTFSENPEYMVNPIYRPIAPKNTVASPCDAKFDGYWKIQDDGNVILPSPSVNFKGIEWPIKKLLDDTELASKFHGGTLMHSFLLPNNYHRVHAPVSGKLVDYKTIPGDVYLEVTADRKKNRIGHIPRFMDPRDGKKQDEDVEAQDTPGYQWNQVRGMWIFETHEEGKENRDIDIGTVVLFAVGMAQISCVVATESPEDDDDCQDDHVKQIKYPQPGQWVNKGDEIGYLKYGGSDYILLFEKDKVEFLPPSFGTGALAVGTPQKGSLYLQGAALVSKK
ncbi:hypothetical protein P170DRAFT_462881 [Aspergillus steynii IBT 23096]|uniref:Phosphatidylserine decarboxylase n=1 Tax=Aspergillus steynii IBT 23096 TaxID=1392250 RepID=A0A2I2GJP0_9EURO|nr:uncharacterized protein P170DRAFT_462881 [Aspergillus steynii IBT 23096]PLB53098.1 hypothetical protein P170DRAFT_462881 [Aspergillus steynii IBT 23096]